MAMAVVGKAGMMCVRLVHFLDEQKRRELMIICGDGVAATGYTAADLRKGGKAHDRWSTIEKGLIARAETKISIDRHPWNSSPAK